MLLGSLYTNRSHQCRGHTDCYAWFLDLYVSRLPVYLFGIWHAFHRAQWDKRYMQLD